MNTQTLIKFIQSSRGLRLDSKFFLKTVFCLPIMLLIVFFCGNWMGFAVKAVSLFVIMLILILNVCYFFCPGRKDFSKYKLLSRPIVVMNIAFPLFYACCLVFYDIFGLEKLLLYYIFPVGVLTLVLVLIAKRKAHGKSKKSSIVSGGLSGGAAFIISRRLNSLMSEKLNETTHFIVIAISMLFVGCITFSIAVLDLWRYYYYTKLEKMGLVTEEILKPVE